MSEVEVYVGHMKPGDIIRRYAYAPLGTPQADLDEYAIAKGGRRRLAVRRG